MFATGTYFVLVLSAMGTSGTLNVDDSDQFFANILKEHNEYRKMHDSTPLYLNRFTIDKAKKTLLEWMKNTTVVPNQPGVNTFSVELSEDLQLNAELAKKIVDTWYTTGEGYNYDVELSKPNNADPFTQVVWKNSHQFGAALNVGEDRLYVVACYIPKGNQPNEYVSNVPKLK